jgi:hypothetical protein
MNDADDGKPNPGHDANRNHHDDLRDQPAFQRLADAVDDQGDAGAMPRRREEQQAVVIDAGLGGEGQPQEQHDEDVSHAVDGAEQQLEGLAHNRSTAGGQRAGAGQGTARGRCG